MKTKLHELLAVEKTRSKEAEGVFNETHAVFKNKPNLFMAKHSSYAPRAEDEEVPPDEHVAMVTTVDAKLSYTLEAMGRAIDVIASKDSTNQRATGDVVLEDGTTLLANVPATTLLHLEKEIARWVDLFRGIPTLQPGRTWEPDDSQGMHVYRDTHPKVNTRTKKVIAHKVLVEPTVHHPAQVEKWSEDVVVGSTTETQWSGMISPAEKSTLIGRAQTLLIAVKQSRQRANCAEVENRQIAQDLFGYILRTD